MPSLKKHWPRWLAHALAAIPLLVLLIAFATNDLTANPIQFVTKETGEWALRLLIISLVISPLNLVSGWKTLPALRRPLGLWAFFYATLHMLTFMVWDYRLDWGLIWEEVLGKRFVIAGLTAFALLLPLAFTSTRGWMKRLGKRWKLLHRLVYVAALVVIVHWVWSVKADYREPLIYGGIVAALLLLRLPPVRRRIGAWRARRQTAVPAKSV